MFRFFVCINLIFIHVFCQISTEDNLQFGTDLFTTQSWEINTDTDASQSWEQTTAEESLQSNPQSDTTQIWQELTTENTSGQGNFRTTQGITSSSTTATTCNTICPPSITPELLEEIKKEILDAVLLNISSELKRIEDLETCISELSCSNQTTITTTTPITSSSGIKLSWMIYENLQIPLTGWLRVFDQPYAHKTRVEDLNQIAGVCHNEVLVGATYNGSITLAAVGPATVLTLNTLWNRCQQFGQVYWYRASGKSFGFSPDDIIRQTSADNQDLESPLRLSWLLDQNMGGYRAGATRSIVDNSLWNKVVYCN